MKVNARLLLAIGAATAALAAPTLALGAGGGPTLTQAPDSGFPDKVYVLQLPEKKALTGQQVAVTENGSPVEGLGVEAPGASSGAILLIDASKSMTGKPIKDAMAAARAFMAQRSPDLPVAVLAFNPNVTTLTPFSIDKHTLEAAVAQAPALNYGTHTYDALEQAAKMANDQGLKRSTVVLLSDGQELGSKATYGEALQSLKLAGVRVISVGLAGRFFNPKELKTVAQDTGGSYTQAANSSQLVGIFSAIGAELANQYVVSYRSLLPPKTDATVLAKVAGVGTATASYTTPALIFPNHGTFTTSWLDKVIASPWLMLFVVIAVLALLVFAGLSMLDVRDRSVRRRMAQYVTVPSEEEGRIRRAEVAAMLTQRAQRHRWWQSFEADVELADFTTSPLMLAGWTLIGGVAASLVAAILLKSFLGLLIGLAAPFVTRAIVSNRVSSKRKAFAEQLPENVDVIAGSLRAGHSLIGAMSVMVDDANEPSKTEFRRVLQDEQLGVPLDEALMVMARRMDNPDVEQVALVTRLSREAGGNTAEVLDRVVETIRGRQELRRLMQVLTAQNRFARWILTALPVGLMIMIVVTTPSYISPLFHTTIGIISLVAWVIMLVAGSLWIKKITTMEV